MEVVGESHEDFDTILRQAIESKPEISMMVENSQTTDSKIIMSQETAADDKGCDGVPEAENIENFVPSARNELITKDLDSDSSLSEVIESHLHLIPLGKADIEIKFDSEKAKDLKKSLDEIHCLQSDHSANLTPSKVVQSLSAIAGGPEQDLYGDDLFEIINGLKTPKRNESTIVPRKESVRLALKTIELRENTRVDSKRKENLVKISAKKIPKENPAKRKGIVIKLPPAVQARGSVDLVVKEQIATATKSDTEKEFAGIADSVTPIKHGCRLADSSNRGIKLMVEENKNPQLVELDELNPKASLQSESKINAQMNSTESETNNDSDISEGKSKTPAKFAGENTPETHFQGNNYSPQLDAIINEEPNTPSKLIDKKPTKWHGKWAYVEDFKPSDPVTLDVGTTNIIEGPRLRNKSSPAVQPYTKEVKTNRRNPKSRLREEASSGMNDTPSTKLVTSIRTSPRSRWAYVNEIVDEKPFGVDKENIIEGSTRKKASNFKALL